MEAAQQPAPAPAKRIGVGDVISETFSIYGQNVGALLGSAIVVFVVVGVIAGLLQTGGLILIMLGAIVQLAGYALYTGFVVELVSDVRDGRRDSTVGDLFEAARPAILPLIGFGILFGIAAGIGFFLFIVPGLFLVTIWAVGAPAIVVEDTGAIDAANGRSSPSSSPMCCRSDLPIVASVLFFDLDRRRLPIPGPCRRRSPATTSCAASEPPPLPTSTDPAPAG